MDHQRAKFSAVRDRFLSTQAGRYLPQMLPRCPQRIGGGWPSLHLPYAFHSHTILAARRTGAKGELFAPNPKGVIIFSNDGHFSLFQSRAEIPKIAANDRAKARPEEAQAIVASAIAYYGTYIVNEGEKAIFVKIVASTFANVA